MTGPGHNDIREVVVGLCINIYRKKTEMDIMVTYSRDSIYSHTPVKDFYLDIWVAKSLRPRYDDMEWTIEPAFDRRPDLAAVKFYGNPRLWYVFALRNKDELPDPIGDFVSGKKIFVPTKEGLGHMIVED